MCHTVEGAPGARVFYELYRDREAFGVHEVAPYIVEFHTRRKAHMAGPDRVEILGRLGTAGWGWPAD